MIESNNYKFEPGAMSIIQMGEELIGHPSTAINELVKNAYDADAGKCWVYTQYDSNPARNFLIIKDDGLGMDAETLFGNWLRPSISSKRDEDKDKRRSEVYERRFLGSKGIGRLASMALGRYLTVITKKSFETEYNWIRIDREIFRVETLLTTIAFPGGKINDFKLLFTDEEWLKNNNLAPNEALINLISYKPFEEFIEGTMIVLQDLDDSVKTIIVEEVDFKEIDETAFFKSLRDLITPLRLNKDIQGELVTQGILSNSQNIDNGSGTFELSYGINFINDNIKKTAVFIPVEPATIIQFYDYRVFGKVTENYEAHGKYLCQRTKEEKIEEDFNLTSTYLLSDDDLRIRRTIRDNDLLEDTELREVGEFYFDIRIYDLDDESKDELARQLKASGRREATQAFSKYLGLKISKNGFGVKPYGEEEQDWLGLGAKRVSQHQVTIGPNQIIGYIFLFSPQNDGLSEKTNREGFFENKAFITFKKIIGGILKETGQRRSRFRIKHNLGRNVKSKLERPDATKFINYILQNHENDSDLIRISKEYIQDSEKAYDNIEDALSFSQRLASLGTGLELVYHELSQPLSSMGASLASLEINIKKIEDEILKQKILDRTNNISRSLITLDTLKSSLQPAIGRSIPKFFKPADTFKKVGFLFENIMIENKISFIAQDIQLVEIKEIEYVFWISFLNIINNAVYWLKKTENSRAIHLTHEKPNIFVLSNSGPLIEEDELDLIFEYGITRKDEKNATGLGLAFTRSLLATRGWEIRAENRDFGPAFLIYKP